MHKLLLPPSTACGSVAAPRGQVGEGRYVERVRTSMAGANGRAARAYSFHGSLLASRTAALRTVNSVGSKPALTAFQAMGIDTVAPGRARADNGATAVAVRSFLR